MIEQQGHHCHTRPNTPVPQFILTNTRSSLYETDNVDEETTFSLNLDRRVRELKKSLGDLHPDVCFTISLVGDACNRNGDYDEALRYYTETLEIKKKILGSDNPSIADTLCSIGTVTKKLSMWHESEATFQAALHIYRNTFTDKSWLGTFDNVNAKYQHYLCQRIILALMSLGTIEFERKNFDLAMKYYNSALKESRWTVSKADVLDNNCSPSTISISKEAQLQVADLHSNVASVHCERGERIEAIEHYNAALAIQISELGEDDPSVACTLHNIGTMNYRSGDLNFALKSYKQVLKMRRYLLGPNHSSIADALINIAMVHEKGGEFTKAETALSVALKVTTIAYGPRSQQVACVKDRLASVYARKGHADSAIELYSDAIEIYQQNGHGSDHPLIQAISEKITHVSCKKSENSSLKLMLTGFLNSFTNDNCCLFTLQNTSNDEFGTPIPVVASSRSVEV